MVGIRIVFEPENATPINGKLIHLGNGAPPIEVIGLEHGTVSGAPSIMLHIELPSGDVVIAETTLKLFLSAADAMIARYGDPR